MGKLEDIIYKEYFPATNGQKHSKQASITIKQAIDDALPKENTRKSNPNWGMVLGWNACLAEIKKAIEVEL